MGNNWSDFCQKAKKLVEAPFSWSQFVDCMQVIDKDAFTDLSRFLKLGIDCGVAQFAFGRKWLLEQSISLFLKKNSTLFDEAPSEAIDCYNAIINKFFDKSLTLSPRKKKTVVALEKPLSFEEKIALFLHKSFRFIDLQKEAEIAKKEGNEEKLAVLEASYLSREKKIQAIHNKKAQFLSQIESLDLEMPMVFRDEMKAQACRDRWEHLVSDLDKVKKDELIIPEQFTTEKEFDDWISSAKTL